MTRVRSAAFLSLVVLLSALGIGSSTAIPAVASPALNLTSKGRALWEFEALLHDQFGDIPVSAHYRQGWWWNFAACRTGCAPLSYWSIYFFTFTNARNSTFHLSSRSARPNLGNYPIPIKVKGRYVPCDRSGSRFLITYSSAAGLAFDCLG
jgi:hypothetical protein